MARNQNLDIETARVLSNPENLIISETLLERLPSKKPAQNCVLSIGDNEYAGDCHFIELEKGSANISLSMESESDKFEFINSEFPEEFFDTNISIILVSENSTTKFSGIPKVFSYDFASKDSCIMTVELYNYTVEASNE